MRLTPGGFSAMDETNYKIIFKDKKFPIPFKEGDNLEFTIENVTDTDLDASNESVYIIYWKLSSFIQNGIQLKTLNSSGFFWDIATVITHRKFESESIFETNSLLKIMIKKI